MGWDKVERFVQGSNESPLARLEGASLRHMSVWQDVQAQAGRTQQQSRWKQVRILGVDGASVLGWGEKRPVLVAVVSGNG